jgi:hypothetical protein
VGTGVEPIVSDRTSELKIPPVDAGVIGLYLLSLSTGGLFSAGDWRAKQYQELLTGLLFYPKVTGASEQERAENVIKFLHQQSPQEQGIVINSLLKDLYSVTKDAFSNQELITPALYLFSKVLKDEQLGDPAQKFNSELIYYTLEALPKRAGMFGDIKSAVEPISKLRAELFSSQMNSKGRFAAIELSQFKELYLRAGEMELSIYRHLADQEGSFAAKAGKAFNEIYRDGALYNLPKSEQERSAQMGVIAFQAHLRAGEYQQADEFLDKASKAFLFHPTARRILLNAGRGSVRDPNTSIFHELVRPQPYLEKYREGGCLVGAGTGAVSGFMKLRHPLGAVGGAFAGCISAYGLAGMAATPFSKIPRLDQAEKTRLSALSPDEYQYHKANFSSDVIGGFLGQTVWGKFYVSSNIMPYAGFVASGQPQLTASGSMTIPGTRYSASGISQALTVTIPSNVVRGLDAHRGRLAETHQPHAGILASMFGANQMIGGGSESLAFMSEDPAKGVLKIQVGNRDSLNHPFGKDRKGPEWNGGIFDVPILLNQQGTARQGLVYIDPGNTLPVPLFYMYQPLVRIASHDPSVMPLAKKLHDWATTEGGYTYIDRFVSYEEQMGRIGDTNQVGVVDYSAYLGQQDKDWKNFRTDYRIIFYQLQRELNSNKDPLVQLAILSVELFSKRLNREYKELIIPWTEYLIKKALDDQPGVTANERSYIFEQWIPKIADLSSGDPAIFLSLISYGLKAALQIKEKYSGSGMDLKGALETIMSPANRDGFIYELVQYKSKISGMVEKFWERVAYK